MILFKILDRTHMANEVLITMGVRILITLLGTPTLQL